MCFAGAQCTIEDPCTGEEQECSNGKCECKAGFSANSGLCEFVN